MLQSSKNEMKIQNEISQSIGKALTTKQSEALKLENAKHLKDAYTASDIVNQEKRLISSGFTKNEIQKLRSSGHLPSSYIQTPSKIPDSVTQLNLVVEDLSSVQIKAMRTGNEKLTYVKSDDGRIFVTKTKLDKEMGDSNSLLMVNSKSVLGGPFPIKEHGKISFNSKTKQFEFEPEYKSETGVSAAVSDKAAQLALKNESKIYECLDILSSQANGKNFIVNRILPDNAVMLGGIAAGEAMGAGRLSTDQGRDVVASDIIGNNINIVVGGYLGSKLATSNMTTFNSIATRYVVGNGMIQLQKNVYENVLDDQATERASKIAEFDQSYLVGRMAFNHYFDKAMVNDIPNLLFNACKNNSKMKIVFNPQSIRLVERAGSAVLYYGLRQSLVNE